MKQRTLYIHAGRMIHMGINENATLQPNEVVYKYLLHNRLLITTLVPDHEAHMCTNYYYCEEMTP